MAKKKRKRFNSLKLAEEFSSKVNGSVNDCTKIKDAKSPYTVTYARTGIDNVLYMKCKGLKNKKSLVSGGLSKIKHTFGTHPNPLFFIYVVTLSFKKMNYD